MASTSAWCRRVLWIRRCASVCSDASGKPWLAPPAPPFRIWPLEKCVDRIVRIIVKRKAQALLPAFVGPLLALDEITGGWLGDWYLGNKFDPASVTTKEGERRT